MPQLVSADEKKTTATESPEESDVEEKSLDEIIEAYTR